MFLIAGPVDAGLELEAVIPLDAALSEKLVLFKAALVNCAPLDVVCPLLTAFSFMFPK